MKKSTTKPTYIFEVSWEVCNLVGGIYTVLSTRANTMQHFFQDHVCFIGPDLHHETETTTFEPDETLLVDWVNAARAAGIPCRAGRWRIPGRPLVLLVDFEHYYAKKTEIYAQMWDFAQIDSLHGYGDYDEASLFSYAAGALVECIVKQCLDPQEKVVYQAHEWMSAMGMCYLHATTPQVATIFTTHATSVGRSITSNDKPLYKYFSAYNGDQMAAELNVASKQSNEKQAAWQADCFTTVSDFTANECLQFLEKPVDVVLENGFENDFVPAGPLFTKKRKAARSKMIQVAQALTGRKLAANTLILATSGRNDYRSKGFDVLLEGITRLQQDNDLERDILMMIEVPCWTQAPREDLLDRLNHKKTAQEPLQSPYITHTLYNFNEERLVNTIKAHGLTNTLPSHLTVVLVPCYLEGNDGVFNLPYYDLLIGADLCLYPSYYEPWGYTPLESVAFKIPCITTNLSGFGQWVNKLLGREATLLDGVAVIPRDDDNYLSVAEDIKEAILTFAALPTKEVTALRKRTANIATEALWSKFIYKYFTAYEVALTRAAQRLNKIVATH